MQSSPCRVWYKISGRRRIKSQRHSDRLAGNLLPERDTKNLKRIYLIKVKRRWQERRGLDETVGIVTKSVTWGAQLGETDQTRSRATETLSKQVNSRRGSINCSSSSSPQEWLLKYRGKILPISHHLYIPPFSPLSPSSHSSLPDNTVDHGHVDPNGQVSKPPQSPKSFISEPSSLWTKR